MPSSTSPSIEQQCHNRHSDSQHSNTRHNNTQHRALRTRSRRYSLQRVLENTVDVRQRELDELEANILKQLIKVAKAIALLQPQGAGQGWEIGGDAGISFGGIHLLPTEAAHFPQEKVVKDVVSTLGEVAERKNQTSDEQAAIETLMAFRKLIDLKHTTGLVQQTASDLIAFYAEIFNIFCPDLESGSNANNILPEKVSIQAQQMLEELKPGKLPVNYLLHTLTEQISIDLSIFEQVINQRKDASVYNTLVAADELARMAMIPATEAWLLDRDPASIVTYLNRRVEIRLLPYAGMTLMGIPFAATAAVDLIDQDGEAPKWVSAPLNAPIVAENGSTQEPSEPPQQFVSSDFLAIPHEIGHLIYQHGQLHYTSEQNPTGSIQQHLENKLVAADWRLMWIEELFADVYCCLVAGPISALGFQELLTDGLLHDDDDGELHEHPFPSIRPLIQNKILRKLGAKNEKYTAVADLLDRKWTYLVQETWPEWVRKEWRDEYIPEANPLLKREHFIGKARVSGQEILDAVDPVLDLILELFSTASSSTWTPDWDPAEPSAESSLTELYDSFVNFARDVWRDAFLAPPADIEKFRNSAIQSSDRDFSWFTGQLENLSRSDDVTLDTIANLVLFNGWSNEGPQAEHSGGGG